jgi:Reverse transcriptase (RNA-dependent DNA polymerase)
MRYLGYPENVVRILEGIYKDTFSAVRVGGDIVGVLQGCVLSPLLFNIFLEVVVAMALDETDNKAIINGEVLLNLRFTDDIALLAENEKEIDGYG